MCSLTYFADAALTGQLRKCCNSTIRAVKSTTSWSASSIIARGLQSPQKEDGPPYPAAPAFCGVEFGRKECFKSSRSIRDVGHNEEVCSFIMGLAPGRVDQHLLVPASTFFNSRVSTVVHSRANDLMAQIDAPRLWIWGLKEIASQYI